MAVSSAEKGYAYQRRNNNRLRYPEQDKTQTGDVRVSLADERFEHHQ